MFIDGAGVNKFRSNLNSTAYFKGRTLKEGFSSRETFFLQ